LAELPQKLLTFIESSADKPSKIRAALEAASVLDTSGSALAPAILERLFAIDLKGLDLDETAHLLLAKSMLFYNLTDIASSLTCIQEASSILESRGTPNSTLAMLHNGVGAILTKQGAYRDSISAYLLCYKTASQVGNDSICLQASSNLALSFVRLGEYENAIKWATRAFACDERGLALHYYLPAAQSSVVAYAMLGKTDQAEAFIRQRTSEFSLISSPGRSQAWALHTADGYAMLGKVEQAEQEGRRATSGVNSRVHLERFVGPYARWVARTSVNQGLNAAHELLDTLIGKLERYDAIDRAEVLNAKAWLSAKTGVVSPMQLAKMRSYLEALPSAVTDQLSCMGMLDFG
jgi:tetratricopeptide (TPR) repeat protein